MGIFVVIILAAIVAVMMIKGKKQQKEEKAIAEKKAAEAAAKAAKRAEEQKKEQEELLKPSCEKGDCWWFSNKFYFTCPANCDCERKTYTKNDWAHEIPDARLIPYIKRLEKANSDQKVIIYKDFMNEYLKQYGKGQWGMAEAILSSPNISHLAEIAFWLGEHSVIDDMVEKLQFLRKTFCIDATALLNPAFKSLSLYKRSVEDFKYSVNIITTVLDKDKLQTYFKDISNISLEQLLDNNGNVLEAGQGGPKNGFYGPCIFNIVESWSGENGENEIEQICSDE